ncbi:hypothetical protein [Ruegeria halocynthiae]|uniref:hypothetical protein n=1 Tax=Ruegeria halocynthiae TaxID=985054 RepID=UPI00055B6CA4|nr:hypothetical protein [Ruegeria halocynthiae]
MITSRGLRNTGGGLLNVKRTKQQIKIDAVERELEKLNDDADESWIAQRLEAGRRLRGLAAD